MKVNPNLEFLYIHSTNNSMWQTREVFDFFSKESKEKIGTLVCHKTKSEFRPDYKGSILAVDFLVTAEHNKGHGKKILKFAEEYSRQVGCNGYMSLKSDVSYTPQSIPHLFYRKYGFSTLDKSADKKMDRFIKQNKPATYKDFPCLLMHYPPAAEKENLLIKTAKNLLHDFLDCLGIPE